MKNVTLLVDSGSDYEPFFAEFIDYKVRMIPLYVYIDGIEYHDGVDINKDTFYEKMNKSANLPKTSQPTPQQFYDIYVEEIKEGNEVLFISLSSKLSGTYQSATIAKNMLNDDEKKKIELVDSLNVSATIELQLLKANELFNQGKSLFEVKKELELYREKTNFIALLDTLENLKKGGRISSTRATIGELLKIKPLITIKNGLVESLENFRGRNRGLKLLGELLKEKENMIEDKYFIIIHNYDNENKLLEDIKIINLDRYQEVIFIKIGSTIGTYAGTNTLGFGYVEK